MLKTLKLTSMKLFILIFCISSITLIPIKVLSQNSNVKIKEDVSLTVNDIFNIIKQQTNYKFIYKESLFKNVPPVTLKKGDVLIDTLLEKCLTQNGFDFTITPNNTILIRENKAEQEKQISGVITDESGLPLPGVSILIKSTTIGTSTNIDGRYTITTPNPQTILEISFLGYETQSIIVGNKFTINVILKETALELNEVVVNGYQQISKERNTGAYAKPNIETVRNRSFSMDIIQRLDGLVPGLVINNAPNTRNGLESRGTVLIRGLNTINAEQDPLFIIDGFPIDDISTINPQDVKDITVLKDATASSIWGSRAANGVIVITTKTGSFGKKMKIDYDTFINFQGKPDINYHPVLNSQQFIETAKTIYDHDRATSIIESDYNLTRNPVSISVHDQILYNLTNGTISQATANTQLNALAATSNLTQIEDLLYRDASVNNHTLSVQGGGETYAYYGSLAYTNTRSSAPSETDKNYKINLNQDFKIRENIDFKINTDLTNNVRTAKRRIKADNRFTPYALFRDTEGNNLSMNAIQYFSPSLREELENASGINLNYIPLDDINTGFTNTNILSLRLNAQLKIRFFKGLTFESLYGNFYQKSDMERFDSEEAYQVRSDVVFFTQPPINSGDPPIYNLPNTGGYYKTINGFSKNWTFRNQLKYTNMWHGGKHELTGLMGYEVQEQKANAKQSFIRGYNLKTLSAPDLNYIALTNGILGTLVINNSLSSTIKPTTNTINEPYNETETLLRFISFYSNIAYTFAGKYSITGSIRQDKSNLFGTDKSAQNKPVWSTGFKWSLSKEPFLDNILWVDKIAIRATYGITGNAPKPGSATLADILDVGFINRNAFTAPQALQIEAPANKTLTWEQMANVNLGLDFSFFNYWLRGSIDYYFNKTAALLELNRTNSITGGFAILENLGNIENKGIEFALQTLNIDRKFKWHTSFIASYNKNKFNSKSLFVEDLTPQYRDISNYNGYPLYPLLAYDFIGLNNQGDPEIRLHDGSITSEIISNLTLKDLKFMGTFQPKWTGSIINNFTFKGFTLGLNIVYNLGHVMFTDSPYSIDYGLDNTGRVNSFTYGNIHKDFINRWQNPGDEASTNIPRYNTNNYDVLNYFTYGDINITSASFIKLRDIMLSYSLPKSITNPIGVNQICFRTQLNNIMLWRANRKGIDPEFHNALRGRRSTPINQNTITLGMHLTF